MGEEDFVSIGCLSEKQKLTLRDMLKYKVGTLEMLKGREEDMMTKYSIPSERTPPDIDEELRDVRGLLKRLESDQCQL